MEAHAEVLAYLSNRESKEHLLKELADLVFVCYQYAAAMGWPLDEAMDRIFESNMVEQSAAGNIDVGVWVGYLLIFC